MVEDLQLIGVSHALVGHSERRLHLGETEELIQRRTAQLLAASIIPILCVGEGLADREAGRTRAILDDQLAVMALAFEQAAVEPHPARFVIAYEPMWAISTSGSHATLDPAEASDAHAHVRFKLDHVFGRGFGDAVSVIFGGSVNASNAMSYFEQAEMTAGLQDRACNRRMDFLASLPPFVRPFLIAHRRRRPAQKLRTPGEADLDRPQRS
jgi:triosephosphate isomerase